MLICAIDVFQHFEQKLTAEVIYKCLYEGTMRQPDSYTLTLNG